MIPVILTSGSGGKVEVACTPQSHILYMIRDWTAREETRRPSARQWSAEYLLPWEILGPAAAAVVVVVVAAAAMSGRCREEEAHWPTQQHLHMARDKNILPGPA